MEQLKEPKTRQKSGLKKALTPDNIKNKKRKIYELDEPWLSAFGKLEKGSRILIYGPPKNGKTHFTLQFMKYLTQISISTAYNSLELGDSLALDIALENVGIKDKLMILNRESVEDCINRFTRSKSPEALVIDSNQYFRSDGGKLINLAKYIEFSRALQHKTIVMTNHAEGRQPGGLGKEIQYDVDVLVYVKGFVAYVQSRYGGGEPIVVWEDGANEYNGLKLLKQ